MTRQIYSLFISNSNESNADLISQRRIFRARFSAARDIARVFFSLFFVILHETSTDIKAARQNTYYLAYNFSFKLAFSIDVYAAKFLDKYVTSGAQSRKTISGVG